MRFNEPCDIFHRVCSGPHPQWLETVAGVGTFVGSGEGRAQDRGGGCAGREESCRSAGMERSAERCRGLDQGRFSAFDDGEDQARWGRRGVVDGLASDGSAVAVPAGEAACCDL